MPARMTGPDRPTTVAPRRVRGLLAPLAALWVLSVPACRKGGGASGEGDGGPPPGSAGPAAASAAAGGGEEGGAPRASIHEGLPRLGVTAFVATVYKEPRDTSRKLGYLRVGAVVGRSAEPAGRSGCPGGWYEIRPKGYVCVGKEATLDLDDPILRAAARRPDLKKPLPYPYGFVRAVLPLYLRVPTMAQQERSEFKLADHLEWYRQNRDEVNAVRLGANDVPIDARGLPLARKGLGELGIGKNSTELSLGQLFGAETDDDPIPFWLEGGKRLVPNISDFVVPEYAVFADRARRFTGLAFLGSFPGGPDAGDRRFAITTDLRLAPTTKVKPDTGSPFHGVSLTDDFTLPLAFVRERSAKSYRVKDGRLLDPQEVPFRSVHALAGKSKRVDGVRYLRTAQKRWLREGDVGLAVPPPTWPTVAERGEKWVEVSIKNQTLVLWEGKRPVYATLVSTGQAGMEDPTKTTATVRGVFRIRNKHVTATMDSNEASAVGGAANTTASLRPVRIDAGSAGADPEERPPPSQGAKTAPALDKGGGKKGAAKGAEGRGGAKGKVEKGGAGKGGAGTRERASGGDAPGAAKRDRDPEYGVTRRRGEGTFQLRDVPWIQYFESGYALHTAYWHDVFGTPRSHGCINLSPVDGHLLFSWTEPQVPEGWHAINTGEEFGEGTVVIVHE